jgi:MFS transporter, putative metabolite transport protein
VGIALDGPDPNAWRWMLLAAAAPCLLVLPLRLTLPESPLWLVNHGQPEKAARIVREKMGRNVAPPVSTPAPPTVEGRWRRLFSRSWRTRTLVACAFFTCLVIPYFAVGTFVSLVMSAMHLESAYGGGLVYNLTLLGGGIAGMLAVDHLSRRRFLIGSFAVAAGTMLILSAWGDLAPVAIVVLFAIFAGVLSAASNLVYVYLPELFPTDLRASGIGLASAVSRIGSAVSTFLLPVIVSAYGIRTALGACVGVLALGALLCQRWAPETKNIQLGALDEVAHEGVPLQ